MLDKVPQGLAQLKTGIDLVLSYGDLSHASGYRTRVLGELLHLDKKSSLDPALVIFDRHPESFADPIATHTPVHVHQRSALIGFYLEVMHLARQKPVRVVHAHNLYSAALALSARRFHGYKVVLDYHGRIPEEYVYLGKGGERSRKMLERLERWCVSKSDHVVVVSERLGEYLTDRYDTPSSKLSVIPCCADAGMFTWDPERRERIRANMGLAGKFVCTHLGSFFEWYETELLLKLFIQIQARNSAAHLLVVTPAVQKAREYLSAQLPAETFTVVSSPHDRVAELLNASDLGCLLLRSSPNIKTSSPAKFSEYLNCGLPVLITQDVGDFSELVRKQKVGMVVGVDTVIEGEFLSKLESSREEYANRCVEAGGTLTWQEHQQTWTRIVERLLE